MVKVSPAGHSEPAEEHHRLVCAVVDEVVALTGGRTHGWSHPAPSVRGKLVRPGVTRGRPGVAGAEAAAEEDENIVVAVVHHGVRELSKARWRTGPLVGNHLGPALRPEIESPRVVQALSPEHHDGGAAGRVHHGRAQSTGRLGAGQSAPALLTG